jgi:hypothetical protein
VKKIFKIKPHLCLIIHCVVLIQAPVCHLRLGFG